MRNRPTMDDVARSAGVSKATVSRVLAGIPNSATEATAQHVRQVASNLGYVVNSLASSLRSRQSFTIGLVVADVSNPFFGNIAIGVEARLAQIGYSVILGNSGNRLEREKAIVRLLVEKQIDGLIVAPSTLMGDHLREAQERGARLVLVDSQIADIAADTVSIDDRAAARTAVDHLLALGHRRIAIVSGPLTAAFDIERLDGYRDAVTAHGIEVSPDLIVSGDLGPDGGRRAADVIAAMAERPTAVFVTNNMMTLGLLVGLSELRLKIPQDISVIAFDDQDWYSVCHPPLSGIVNPGYDIGVTAAERLLLAIEAPLPLPHERILLPYLLKQRSSVRDMRQAGA